MTEKQLDALRDMKGHGNTMRSLHRHRLIYRDGNRGWKRGVRGELVLAGWSLAGLELFFGLSPLSCGPGLDLKPRSSP